MESIVTAASDASSSATRTARLVIVGPLVVGTAFVVISFAIGRNFEWSDVLYDVGVGVLIAGGVSLAAAVILQSAERRAQQRVVERERREEQLIRQAELQRQAVEQVFVDFARQADELGRHLDVANVEANFGLLEIQLREVDAHVSDIERSLNEFRRNIDSKFVDPNKATVDGIMERLKNEIRSDERSEGDRQM